MNVPVLGLVENMAYTVCPHCGEKIQIFGVSHAAEVAAKEGTTLIDTLPINGNLTSAMDDGKMEYFDEVEIKGLEKVLPPLQ